MRSPLNSRIGRLTGTCTITYVVDFTRGEAINVLIDAGCDPGVAGDMPDDELMRALVDSDCSDEVRDYLDDVASEDDSSSIKWEVDQ